MELILFANEYDIEWKEIKENIYDSNIFGLSNWEDSVAIYGVGKNEEEQIWWG